MLTEENGLNVVRFAPPLVISRAESDWAMDLLVQMLASRAGHGRHAEAV